MNENSDQLIGFLDNYDDIRKNGVVLNVISAFVERFYLEKWFWMWKSDIRASSGHIFPLHKQQTTEKPFNWIEHTNFFQNNRLITAPTAVTIYSIKYRSISDLHTSMRCRTSRKKNWTKFVSGEEGASTGIYLMIVSSFLSFVLCFFINWPFCILDIGWFHFMCFVYREIAKNVAITKRKDFTFIISLSSNLFGIGFSYGCSLR